MAAPITDNSSEPEDFTKTENRIDECLQTLDFLNKNPDILAALPEEKRINLFSAAGRLSRPDIEQKKERNRKLKRNIKQKNREREKLARTQTGIRAARRAEVFTAPKKQILQLENQSKISVLESPRNCYICKKEFTELHFFYDAMCPECASFNYEKRFQTADLRGQTALITGSRLKIGYQAALMLLRAGADVIATTRFPKDAAQRYAGEEDFDQWRDRLHIYGLDLRHTPSVELFCNYIGQHYARLDILMNNAAQTVRRPPQFYAHLMAIEEMSWQNLPDAQATLLSDYRSCLNQLASHSSVSPEQDNRLPVSWNGEKPGIGLLAPAELSQIAYNYHTEQDSTDIFPAGKLDADLQQLDLRKTNSWRLYLGEISTSEMLELQLINSIAPFVLCNKLTPMMKRENTGKKHIVNVSAMEGKFLRFKKDGRHPHTNMAKAALNMLTHSSAGELSKHGIFMNAVDTGWVTDEDPQTLAERKQKQHDFQPPLDIVDGAARICDPIFNGINTGTHFCGKFLKDYFPIDW